MWSPKYCVESEISKKDIESLISGKIPAIIIQNFFKKNQCEEITKKIGTIEHERFQDKKLKHIGPFLMAYSTRKKSYFESAKKFQKIFNNIFLNQPEPSGKIHSLFKNLFSNYSISLAEENKQKYSSLIIRIHENGKSIPIHKDNVKYEGTDYNLSEIDYQLSCVLHLQESDDGGDLIIYDKNWKKEDEKFRQIEFGYSAKLVCTSKFCRISDIKRGDLVIINPNYFHQVTKIQGATPRISLGMFIGISKKKQKIVSWA